MWGSGKEGGGRGSWEEVPLAAGSLGDDSIRKSEMSKTKGRDRMGRQGGRDLVERERSVHEMGLQAPQV